MQANKIAKKYSYQRTLKKKSIPIICKSNAFLRLFKKVDNLKYLTLVILLHSTVKNKY